MMPDPAASATADSAGRFQRNNIRSYGPSNENASSVPRNKPDETGAASATRAAVAPSAKIPSARRCIGDEGEARGGSGKMLARGGGSPLPLPLRGGSGMLLRGWSGKRL